MLAEKILTFCSESLSADFFSIQSHNAKKQQIFSNYPEQWVSYYKENHLWNSDPAVQNSTTQDHGALWGEEANKKPSAVILEARDYNIRSGFSKTITTPTGGKYTLTLSSKRELELFKGNLSTLEISQIIRYGLILDRILSENITENELEKTLEYLKYEAEIYQNLKRQQDRTLTVLHTLKSEIKSSSPISILDQQTFLADYAKKMITDLY